MINFRFYLVSVIAVFLALGVGVAMGASFVDRATVESLRGQLDQLSEGYQRRGRENDALREQLAESDSQASVLAGDGSDALSGQLLGQRVVLVVPDGVPTELFDATRTSLAASDSSFSGSIRVQPSMSMGDADVLAQTRTRFGVRSGTAEEVADRVIGAAGRAFGLLAEDATGADRDTATTTTAPDTATDGDPVDLLTPTDAESSRELLVALSDLGLITIDTADAQVGAAFPVRSDVRYVMVVSSQADPEANSSIVPLAAATSEATGGVVTVGEAREPRPEGEATTTTAGEPARGEALSELRQSESAERLSTVDNLEESNGRIGMVYAVSEQSSGVIGHYGSGAGATAPFPTTTEG